jgi:hypothetical protein
MERQVGEAEGEDVLKLNDSTTISSGKGVYKLLYILPIFQHSKRILLLDFKDENLKDRLSSMEADVDCWSFSNIDGTPSDGTRFDIIIGARLPAYLREKKRFLDNVVGFLNEEGYFVSVFSNSLGFSGLKGRIRRGTAGGRPEDLSLARGRKGLRDLGFSEVGIFAPVPDISNPTAFLSLKESNSLRFMLSNFPGFRKKRSLIHEGAMKLLIGTNSYKYFLNQYVIVSRKEL